MDTTFSVTLASLRPLKNALRDAFPSAKSSHLSEALAAGLGYNTYAAQLASQKSVSAYALLTMRPTAFYARLQQLGYSTNPPINIAKLHVDAVGASLPEKFREDQARLLEILDSNAPGAPAERARLRRRLATSFGAAFGLGHIATDSSRRGVVQQLQAGIDFKACSPHWGAVVNQNHTSVDFPGQSHMQYYYDYLPLNSGKTVEYCTARVSMPYVNEDGTIPELAEAQKLALHIGWKVEIVPEWSWHMAGATSLVLFRRTTTHEEMSRMWQTSFKKWLFENKQRFVKSRSWIRKQVVTDMLTCPHFPLDVTSFDELRNRYLAQYAPYLLHGRDDRITDFMRTLFETWAAEQTGAAA